MSITADVYQGAFGFWDSILYWNENLGSKLFADTELFASGIFYNTSIMSIFGILPVGESV